MVALPGGRQGDINVAMASLAEPVIGSPGTGLPEVLTLERIEDDMFRTVVVSREPAGLFGGQVAAQALRAAAQTVPEGRHPHSLHGYFLSRGDASRRVLLTVNRDRDGGSYSNRRVIAVQNGKVIFNMAASFHVTEEGSDYQAHEMPEVEPPEDLPENQRLAPHARRRDPAPARSRSPASSGRPGCGSGRGTSWTAT